MVWTIIPIIFLVFIALPSLYLLYITEDVSSYSISVKVIGHQWYWEYEYYLNNISVCFNSYMLQNVDSSSVLYRLLDVDNRLCVPSMLSTIVIVTSADVLHSWTVPSIGVNADAIPGRLNYLNLTPHNYGVYYGQCSELCGTNHSFMPIVLEVSTVNNTIMYLKTFV